LHGVWRRGAAQSGARVRGAGVRGAGVRAGCAAGRRRSTCSSWSSSGKGQWERPRVGGGATEMRQTRSRKSPMSRLSVVCDSAIVARAPAGAVTCPRPHTHARTHAHTHTHTRTHTLTLTHTHTHHTVPVRHTASKAYKKCTMYRVWHTIRHVPCMPCMAYTGRAREGQGKGKERALSVARKGQGTACGKVCGICGKVCGKVSAEVCAEVRGKVSAKCRARPSPTSSSPTHPMPAGPGSARRSTWAACAHVRRSGRG